MKDARLVPVLSSCQSSVSRSVRLEVVALKVLLVSAASLLAQRVSAQEYSVRPISIDELPVKDLAFQVANPDTESGPPISGFLSRFHELADGLRNQGRHHEFIQIARVLLGPVEALTARH